MFDSAILQSNPAISPRTITIRSPLTHPTSLLLEISRSTKELQQIHAQMTKNGLVHDTLAASRIIAFCAVSNPENNSMNYARSVFNQLRNPNSFIWNTMIRGYSQSCNPEEAIFLYYQMLFSETPFDKFTFPFVLKACSELCAVEEGKQVQSMLLKKGFGMDIFVQNSLINFYAVCGSIGDASQLFKRSSQSDVVSWNSMVVGLIRGGSLVDARKMFDEMPQRSLASWNAMIAGYSQSRLMTLARPLFDQMPERDANSWNSMIDGYIKSGSLESARCLFDQMPCCDSISWIIMIDAYVQGGFLDSARQLFDKMPQRELIVWNFMIGGYVKIGQMQVAQRLFEQMPERDLVSWNTMITGYVHNGQFKEALNLFQLMQIKQINPDNITFGSLLSACARLGALEQGQWIHAYLEKNKVQLDTIHGTALIDMYSKCGKIEKAITVFNQIHEKDVGMWNSMIVGLGIHGHAASAFQCFTDMLKDGVRPNEITFIGVLSACSHGGLVDEGYRYFSLMRHVHGVSPNIKHYGCMVDLLGRAGRLQEAEELIKTMPIEPDEVVWGTLVAACRKHGNVAMGETVAKQLIKLNPNDASGYVLLSNIYAGVGQWDDAIKIRKMMKDRGVKKIPGCSSIELDGGVHEFLAGDRSHPQDKEIYTKLDEMVERLKVAGYNSDTSQVLFDIDEEDRETAVHRHSEKLALALGLICTDPKTTIRIAKNLRVCLDCHSATKVLSKVYDREIIVRDRIRFHHFRNGSCSCKDYW